jgi:hypothetical protein
MTFVIRSRWIAVCAAALTLAAQSSVVVAETAEAPASPVPTPTQKPNTQKPASGKWPKTLPDAAKTLPVSTTWPQIDIDLAHARCVQVLKGLDVVAIPAPPMREGDCGAPAPIELVSVGKSPQVTFSPPVIVTCDLAATMHTWIKNELQPIAKRHLGADVIRIDTMSSYSCRNAYGRTKNRLSEHGKANAIDIRGFMTSKSEYAEVLTDWGPNARDIQAQVAAARANAEKAEQQRVLELAAAAKARSSAPGATAQGPISTTGQTGQPHKGPGPAPQGADSQTAALPDLRPSISVSGQGVGLPQGTANDSALGLSGIFNQPARLGGPKAPEAARAIDSQRHTQFLRAAHASACKTFGTTLGPEANEAHRNHFHLDLAERITTKFCE